MIVQSNGIGVQSWTLYFMSCMGIIPRFDYSIFADPGRESKDSYRYLKWAMNWQKENNGIPIIWTGKKSLYADLIKGTNSDGNRIASIPAYTLNPDGTVGMLNRQCTSEYKIEIVDKEIRQLHGLPARKRIPRTQVVIGISVEEFERMKIPKQAWRVHVYPFVNYIVEKKNSYQSDFLEKLGKRFSKADCIQWLKKNGFPVPPKSSCIICPYTDDARWLEMKRNRPKEWKAAVRLDHKIRNSYGKGVNYPVFLHRSCKPLDQVYLREDQQQLYFDCSGSCGI